jgi:hypothetical protein
MPLRKLTGLPEAGCRTKEVLNDNAPSEVLICQIAEEVKRYFKMGGYGVTQRDKMEARPGR